MKNIVLLISILLVSFVLNKYCGGTASKFDDCKDLEKVEGISHCCFVEAEYNGEEAKMCVPLTKAEYDNIGDYVKKATENAPSGYDYDIDCGSSYLYISLLGLLLFLI